MIEGRDIRHVRVTLEKPWRGGALSFRMGSTDPRRNPMYDSKRPESGGVFLPGEPILLGPLTAGDGDRDSCVITAEQAKHLFGDWEAPQGEQPGRPRTWTHSQERSRVAMLWGWFQLQAGDGTANPPMGMIGPPDVPFVALRPLDAQMRPIKVNGAEVVHHPREFYDFDNGAHYAQSLAMERARGVTSGKPVDLEALRAEIQAEVMASVRAELNKAKTK